MKSCCVLSIDPFSIVTRFIIAYRNSQVKVQTNYCNNNLLIVDVKQLNKIRKLYYFHALKALWNDQGKIKMYYGMSRAKKQLSVKRSITAYSIFILNCVKYVRVVLNKNGYLVDIFEILQHNFQFYNLSKKGLEHSSSEKEIKRNRSILFVSFIVLIHCED